MKMSFHALRGEGLRARALRSTVWTVGAFGAYQAIRLASNLILTRLLFPEAFGMMALIMLIIQALAMLSDLGVHTSVQQNPRGDEPRFLNTAWTIQIIRGACLWLAASVLALPLAGFYQEPMLAAMLPVAALSLLVAGFNPSAMETANRHLMLGRVTLIDLMSQVLSIVLGIALAWATGSVWSLVISIVLSALARLALAHLVLTDSRNRFQLDYDAARELVHFGKWIFLSTACGFLIGQGDRVILGKYLSLDAFGIYNIGYFLASFPIYLATNLVTRLLIPLYRERPPAASSENFSKIRWTRFALTGFSLPALVVMALVGQWAVEILYDARYAEAGAVVVVVSLAQIPLVIGITYDPVALAAGDSRRFFIAAAVKAVVLVGFMIVGAEKAGVLGVAAGQGLALLLLHPMVIWLARCHRAWDPLHDGFFAVVGLTLGGLALLGNWTAVTTLARL